MQVTAFLTATRSLFTVPWSARSLWHRRRLCGEDIVHRVRHVAQPLREAVAVGRLVASPRARRRIANQRASVDAVLADGGVEVIPTAQ